MSEIPQIPLTCLLKAAIFAGSPQLDGMRHKIQDFRRIGVGIYHNSLVSIAFVLFVSSSYRDVLAQNNLNNKPLRTANTLNECTHTEDSLGMPRFLRAAEEASTDESAKSVDRILGSAWFGGEGDPPIFGTTANTSGTESSEWPNISEPGPDMGDFPNSAFTLPKGRSYLEVAPVTLLKADAQNPDAYAAPFLFRYGITNDVEFRVFGHGLTSVGGSNSSTGMSPLNFDLKVHLWNDRKEWFLPAASLEVYVLTQTGSPQFNGGIEPSINLNFDLPLTKKLNLEWTVGRSGVQQAINTKTGKDFIPRFNYLVPGLHQEVDLNFEQFSASWAIEYEVSDRLEVFLHGMHNGSVLLNFGAGDAVGSGLFWKFSPRLTGFGSLNWGLTPNLPPLAGQLGFAIAL